MEGRYGGRTEVPGVPLAPRVMHHFVASMFSYAYPAPPPCGRYDLEPTSGSRPVNWTARAFGAVDGKVVDAASFAEGATHVICGPTADDQPAFSWLGFCPLLLPGGNVSQQPLEGSSCNISHIGLVDTFDFQWQRYRGSLPWA